MGMNENILVTGGLGFIGSWYVKLLAKEGYYPIILDLNTYAADINRIKGSDYEDEIYVDNGLYIGDICDKKLVKDIIQKHDINTIVNFAASTHVDRSIQSSDEFVKSNFVGVRNLLDIVRENKENENDIKFIQISTDETYGSTRWNDESFKETDRLNPGNPYSASKASADLLCLSYWNTYGLDIVITRSSNNYGPWQHIEKFIPRMISLAIQGKDLEVYGGGDNIRDWLWVEDNCEGILAVMKDGVSGDIYNIGAGNEFTNNQVAKIIADRFNVGIEYIEDRKGHDFRYSINCNKIMNELGWEPKVSFEKGIEKTIKFYENYQNEQR